MSVELRAMLVVGVLVFAGCSRAQTVHSHQQVAANEPAGEFAGIWKGSYAHHADEIVIRNGEQPDQFEILLHTHHANSSRVTGRLVADNRIEIPMQEIGGAPGAAWLTLRNSELILKQTGMGITMTGTYRQMPTLVTESAVALPEDLPNDVPIYPNGTVTMVYGQQLKKIRMSSVDSIDAISQYMHQEIARNGWEFSLKTKLSIQANKQDRKLIFDLLLDRSGGPTKVNEFVVQYSK